MNTVTPLVRKRKHANASGLFHPDSAPFPTEPTRVRLNRANSSAFSEIQHTHYSPHQLEKIELSLSLISEIDDTPEIVVIDNNSTVRRIRL